MKSLCGGGRAQSSKYFAAAKKLDRAPAFSDQQCQQFLKVSEFRPFYAEYWERQRQNRRAQSNKRLERTRHKTSSIRSSLGEPLKRNVVLLLQFQVMAFTPRQISNIHRVVGRLCRVRVPEEVQDQIRLGYVIERHEIVIVEARAPWRDSASEWSEMEIAKLRYVAQRREWKLYWKRASGKWWLYAPHSNLKSLTAMVREIEFDSDGCFFG
jgi:hypothetical protein